MGIMREEMKQSIKAINGTGVAYRDVQGLNVEVEGIGD
jgi:hypothetical protein